MSDWLDELLLDLPGDRPPEELIASVRQRLAAAQRSARRWERGSRALASALALISTWLLWGASRLRLPQLVQPGLSEIRAALAAAIDSPLEALSALAAEVVSRAGTLESGVMLGLALLAAPALYLAVQLMPRQSPQNGADS